LLKEPSVFIALLNSWEARIISDKREKRSKKVFRISGRKMKNLEKTDVKRAVEFLRGILADLGLGDCQIMLFGSRARGDYTGDSDYDFLVIIQNPMSLSEKRKVTSFIRMRMAESNIPVDVFLKDMRDYESYKDIVGSLSYEVGKDGIAV